MELSERLSAVAGLVTEGASVADIGTDHGYIPIYLIRQGISPGVIAMDINEGPLERARAHIAEWGLEDRIKTRRSDGLAGLQPFEADTMIAAGMGGSLVIHILEGHPAVTESLNAFILQPQSEIPKVRKYLNDNGFCLVAEDMVEEDGKFYPMMKLVHGTEPVYTEEELYYGRLLLRERHPVLGRYLQKEEQVKRRILESLECKKSAQAGKRIVELKQELARVERALANYNYL